MASAGVVRLSPESPAIPRLRVHILSKQEAAWAELCMARRLFGSDPVALLLASWPPEEFRGLSEVSSGVVELAFCNDFMTDGSGRVYRAVFREQRLDGGWTVHSG